MYLGLLKCFTCTLGGNNLLFVQSEQADAQQLFAVAGISCHPVIFLSPC